MRESVMDRIVRSDFGKGLGRKLATIAVCIAGAGFLAGAGIVFAIIYFK